MKDLLTEELENKGFSYTQIDILTQNISNNYTKNDTIDYIDNLISMLEEAQRIIRKNF